MPSTVYVETSVLGYLTIRPTEDVIIAATHAMTRAWWENERPAFDLYSSDAVREEIAAGDPEMASRRLAVLADLPLLDISDSAARLAQTLLIDGPLPAKAQFDALHIAVAAIHGVDYLLTWNCKHIANAAMRPSIERLCRVSGFEPPIMCTPQELTHG